MKKYSRTELELLSKVQLTELILKLQGRDRPKYLSKSNVNFKDDYSHGFKHEAFFKPPKNTEKIELYFDENGRLYCMSILYQGKSGMLIETEYSFTEYDTSKNKIPLVK